MIDFCSGNMKTCMAYITSQYTATYFNIDLFESTFVEMSSWKMKKIQRKKKTNRIVDDILLVVFNSITVFFPLKLKSHFNFYFLHNKNK